MLGYFPDPHPDEVLYSVWARYSDHVGYPYFTDALQDLFGNRDVQPIVDLPCHLEYFFHQLPYDHSYTIEEFINRHTLLPFYRPFLSQERVDQVQEQMLKDDPRTLHQRAGVVTGGMSSPLWLRYCSLCVEDDKRIFAEAYWHRLHQISGVEVCPLHEVFLEQSTARARGKARGSLRLCSADSYIQQTFPREATSSPFFHTLKGIAVDIAYLLETPLSAQNPQFLRQQYAGLFARHDLLTLRGKFRLNGFIELFENTYPQELLNSLQYEIERKTASKGLWLKGIIHPHKHVRRPLQHILVIRALGETVQTFLSQPFVPPPLFGDGPWPCLNPVCEYFQQRVIQTYQLAQYEIEREIVGTFTCSCGYSYSATPSALASDAFARKRKVYSYGMIWEKELCTLWSDLSLSRRDIALRLGVHEGTVINQATRLHLPLPRLNPHSLGNQELIPPSEKKSRNWYREQFLALVKDHPEESIYTMKGKMRGIVTWLNRHDREWFFEHRPLQRSRVSERSSQKESRSRTRQSWKNWRIDESRDRLMAEQVKAEAPQLFNEVGRPTMVSLQRICHEILQSRDTSLLAHAPLTAKAMRELAETYEAFALRRIQWALQQYQEEHCRPTRWQFILKAGLTKNILLIQCVQQALDEAIALLSQFG